MASTVLITGASEGIGYETARLFAHKGYDLILAARHADKLTTVAQEIEALGRSALAVPTDTKAPEQVKELVNRALNHYGSIDILINNAGIYISGPVEEFSLDDWHQAIDTNLWGYIHTIHALLPHFVSKGSGTIVNVGSIGGKVPLPFLTPYTTSKYAVTGLTEALHSELAPKGIHVAGIYPNIIKSNFLERAIFAGKDKDDAKARREQVETILKVPFIEKTTDVAQAIWDAVEHKKSSVIVGSANISNVANNVFPSLMQWVFRKTFKFKAEA